MLYISFLPFSPSVKGRSLIKQNYRFALQMWAGAVPGRQEVLGGGGGGGSKWAPHKQGGICSSRAHIHLYIWAPRRRGKPEEEREKDAEVEDEEEADIKDRRKVRVYCPTLPASSAGRPSPVHFMFSVWHIARYNSQILRFARRKQLKIKRYSLQTANPPNLRSRGRSHEQEFS